MYIVKEHWCWWDDVDTFQVEAFEEIANAQKRLYDRFVDVVKEWEFDDFVVKEIMSDLDKDRRVDIEQDWDDYDTDVRYEQWDFFELICDDSWLKVFAVIEEIDFNHSLD